MDIQSQQSLARLVRDERIAALGTLFHGAPLVSLVLFSAADDLSAIHIHVSWLDPCKIRRTTVVGSKKMIVYDDVSSLEKIRV